MHQLELYFLLLFVHESEPELSPWLRGLREMTEMSQTINTSHQHRSVLAVTMLLVVGSGAGLLGWAGCVWSGLVDPLTEIWGVGGPGCMWDCGPDRTSQGSLSCPPVARQWSSQW